jgi:hypothetical protein
MRCVSLLLVTTALADYHGGMEHSTTNLAGTTDTTMGTYGMTRAQMESKTHSPGTGFAWQEQTHTGSSLIVNRHEAESANYKFAVNDTFEHENRIGENFDDDTKQYVPEGFDSHGPIKHHSYHPMAALMCCKQMCHTQSVDKHFCKIGCHKWLLNALQNWNMASYGYLQNRSSAKNRVSNGDLLLKKCKHKCTLNERERDARDNLEACETGCDVFKTTCHSADHTWEAPNATRDD